MNVAVTYNTISPVVTVDNTGTNVTAEVIVTSNNFNVSIASGVPGPVGPPGPVNKIQSIRKSVVLAEVFAATDYTLNMDTGAGNANVNVTPAIIAGQLGNIKKISSDTNTLTLTVTAGHIYFIGAPVTSMVWDGQGESTTFHSDGTDLFIL